MKNSGLKKLNNIHSFRGKAKKLVESKQVSKAIDHISKNYEKELSKTELQEAIRICLVTIEDINYFKSDFTQTDFKEDLVAIRDHLQKARKLLNRADIKRQLNVCLESESCSTLANDEMDLLIKVLGSSKKIYPSDTISSFINTIAKVVANHMTRNSSGRTGGIYTEKLIMIFNKSPKIKHKNLYCLLTCLNPIVTKYFDGKETEHVLFILAEAFFDADTSEKGYIFNNETVFPIESIKQLRSILKLIS